MGSTAIGELLGWDIVIVIGILALLFGGSQLPKFARSLGEAKKEFEQGVTKPGASDKKPKAEKGDAES